MNSSVDLQSAREAVRLAKRALKKAEFRFDHDCGPDNCASLMSEIRTAERRLAQAVSVLNKMPPSHRLAP